MRESWDERKRYTFISRWVDIFGPGCDLWPDPEDCVSMYPVSDTGVPRMSESSSLSTCDTHTLEPKILLYRVSPSSVRCFYTTLSQSVWEDLPNKSLIFKSYTLFPLTSVILSYLSSVRYATSDFYVYLSSKIGVPWSSFSPRVLPPFS